MPRLPLPGQDAGTWGNVLNDYLSQSLAADGSLKANSVGSNQLQAGAVTAAKVAADVATQAGVDAAVAARVPTSAVGATGGVASLDGGGKVPVGQLPLAATSVVAGGATGAVLRKRTSADYDTEWADMSSTYAQTARQKQAGRVGGMRIGWLGDSITNGSQSTNAAIQSFTAMVPKILGTSRVKFVSGYNPSVNGGVTGNTSAQALARLDALLAANNFDVLWVMVGTNDASQSVGLSTFQSNIIAMKAKADAKGIPIGLSLVPPRGVAGGSACDTENTFVRQYNLWLRFWCRANGVPCADTYSALVDTVTGKIASAYNTASSDGTGGPGDATHPNNAGHLALAYAIAPVLGQLCPSLTPWPLAAAFNGGLATDPLGATSSWSVIAGPLVTATQTVISRTDWPDMLAPSGRRITYDNSASGSSTSSTVGRNITTGFSVGDRILIVTQLRNVAGVSGSVGKVQIMDQSNVVKSVIYESGADGLPGPMAYVFTVPAGMTTLKIAHIFGVAANSTNSIDIGGMDAFNLTTLGIADIA
jgi:lysophospholipase L1-like esterase